MRVKLENQKCRGRYFELSANKKTKENNKGNEKPSRPIITQSQNQTVFTAKFIFARILLLCC